MTEPTKAEYAERLRKMRWEAQQARNAELLGGNGHPPAAPAPVAPQQISMLSKVVIKATHFTGAMIITESEYRDDVLKELRKTEGRVYRGDRENMIPLGQWKDFVARVTALENVTVVIDKAIREELDWHLNAPVWLVKVGLRWFEAVYGPRADQFPMYSVPGAEKKQEEKMWKIPLTEGWRLYEKLEGVEGVVYTEEASKMILSQIEARAMLDKIATMERGIKYLDYDFEGAYEKSVNKKADFPMGTSQLRPFQEVGCEFIDAAGGRVIVADEMGLGKTWQALAYAVKNDLRVVVICPASLKANWAREIRKLTGKAPNVLSGAEPTQYDLIKYVTEPSKHTIINYDIVGRAIIVKKSTVDAEGYTHEETKTRYLWVELINMSKPDLVIVDEGHYIKNTDSNRSQAVREIKAPRIIFMTGTPVLNRPGELWPMLTMIAPDQFPAHETFLNQYTYDGKTAKNVEELRTLMRPLMIRRLKKDVVKELPPINRINEYHELSEKALNLYRKVEAGVYEAVAEYSAKGESNEQGITNILVQIGRLKQVCAIDKVDQTAELAEELYEGTDASGNRKVLIFSQYKACAYAIWQRLADQGALCFVTKGAKEFRTADNEERDRLVQQFQNDPNIRYLVVTEKTTKEGHNITAAGHVIFNDLFWTPAGHEQAEGRAYGRLSDLHSINAYYMITAMEGDSIEEWIMELLAAKMRMINEVVEGVEASRDVSVLMDLIEKMKGSMWRRAA
jgi:SWI/SNF-related matrix-associated actin-dependent regulator of chromatin subfamily A-like protein 1